VRFFPRPLDEMLRLVCRSASRSVCRRTLVAGSVGEMSGFRITLCVALLACGCGAKQTPAESSTGQHGPSEAPSSEPVSASGGKPIGTKLMRDVDASEKKFEIGENRGEGGLGKYSLRLDGKYIWPPQGQGCETLVKCCNELATTTDNLALVCLLALGRDGNCSAALETSTQIAREQSVAVPASCTH
jgi:hypothetical protein